MNAKSAQSGGKSESEPEPRKPHAAKSVSTKSAVKKTAPAKKTAAKKAAGTQAAASAKKPARAKTRKRQPAQSQLEITQVSAAGGVEESHAAVPEPQSEPAAMMEAYRADVTSEAEQGQPELEPAARSDREAKSRKKAIARAVAAGEPLTGAENPAEGEAAAISEPQDEESGAVTSEPAPEQHLERLQKILSQAGVTSRRHAEEMIVAGRVMINGQVVSQLGAKADAGRDHIRVDGKLLQISVRHRTFMLNKPKGYVTTVSDPEGRPTVMQFFEKVRERLYPVGRLDFQSEGLLLVTNDGELSNALTRAASGVEKIYLVKVAGQPGADAIERLRAGVSIERGEQGSSRVRTAPATIRQIRRGENPWFEVILTEGRNRELRKMFQTIGHYVEKIRRVAYGPLVLDVEPGQTRELRPEEVDALRLTAEGKLKPKRPRADTLLPKEAGRPAEERSGFRPRRGAEGGSPRRATGAPSSSRPYREMGGRPERPRQERPFRPRDDRGRSGREGALRGERPARREGGQRPEGGRRFERPGFDRAERRPFSGPGQERTQFEGRPKGRFGGPREERGGAPRFGQRSERPFEERNRERGERLRFDRGNRGGLGQRPPRSREEGSREERPRREFRPREESATRGERPARFGGERRGWNRQEGRPGGSREGRPRREGAPRSAGEGGRRPGNGSPQNRRPGFGGGRPNGGRPGGGRKGGPPRRDRG